MSFGSVPNPNMEVFNKNFDYNDLESRDLNDLSEHVKLSEQVERIDSVDLSMEDSFKEIEKVARKNIEEARIMSQSVLMQSEYFYKIGGIQGNELQNRMWEIEKLFDSYFANLQAALLVLNEELSFEKEIDVKIKNADSVEEFNNLRNMKTEKSSIKKDSYKRMSDLYHLAEQKIREKLKGYFPRKIENNKIAA